MLENMTFSDFIRLNWVVFFFLYLQIILNILILCQIMVAGVHLINHRCCYVDIAHWI